VSCIVFSLHYEPEALLGPKKKAFRGLGTLEGLFAAISSGRV
jgi:hypothetical protein